MSRVYGKISKGFSSEYPCKPFVVNLPATAEQSDARADDDVTKKEKGGDRSGVRHGLKNGHVSLQIGLFHVRKDEKSTLCCPATWLAVCLFALRGRSFITTGWSEEWVQPPESVTTIQASLL